MTASVTCSACGRIVGVYRNGRIRPHYSGGGLGLCSGAYGLLPPSIVPSPNGAGGGTIEGVQAIAEELLELAHEAGGAAA